MLALQTIHASSSGFRVLNSYHNFTAPLPRQLSAGVQEGGEVNELLAVWLDDKERVFHARAGGWQQWSTMRP
ncbi:MAG TPA: hypothetical protein VHW09_07540 [Bryobacteraceae bacterium]|jgi:hypothetical protein|nr:hypothetical protein [Bryobacteraceae bacterium]